MVTEPVTYAEHAAFIEGARNIAKALQSAYSDAAQAERRGMESSSSIVSPTAERLWNRWTAGARLWADVSAAIASAVEYEAELARHAEAGRLLGLDARAMRYWRG